MPAATDMAVPTDRAAVAPRVSAGCVGAALLVLIAAPCVLTLPWSLGRYDRRADDPADWLQPPGARYGFGTDLQGRSMLWQCLLGGAISLAIGASAAALSVVIGVAWGATAGYVGGRVDAALMRIVDVLYGLPYILLVGLANLSLKPVVDRLVGEGWRPVAGVLTLVVTLGALSWLTMARVIRGQVLSLRAQPFIEAARACGVGPARVLCVHLLPNLVGPIVVYTTLTVPSVILQESFLSFLGLGVQPPLPSWGRLTSEGVKYLPTLAVDPARVRWWLVL